MGISLRRILLTLNKEIKKHVEQGNHEHAPELLDIGYFTSYFLGKVQFVTDDQT